MNEQIDQSVSEQSHQICTCLTASGDHPTQTPPPLFIFIFISLFTITLDIALPS